ncbi:MAG: Asp23/Gls24 family envelope stress response protein [Actinomycetota bacterium]|nr:Asp23/Gls24 family envelope stress response protein [Actinomycetota bacterium]MDP9439593.1 Asp23/Gls24 family envelope stress response protein [Actinomycetota bacterium]
MSEQSATGGGPLQTERGNTNIADSVVAKIAGIAAQEVDGIRMGSGASQTASNLLGSITGGSGGSQTQGVSVEVGQEEAALDLTLTAEYGKSIPQLAEAVRRNVANRIESLVGLRVTEVNITVQNIFFPQQEQEQERQRQLEQQQREQQAQEQQRVQ